MADLKTDYKNKDSFWRRWAAVIILVVFFLLSWAGQFLTQLQAEKQNTEQHNQAFKMSDYWPQFWSATFENWQSEWLQLATQALIVAGFSSYLFRKGDEEHYKTQLMIEDLQKQLKQRQIPS